MSQQQRQKRRYTTWLPITLVFDTKAISQDEADAMIVSLSYTVTMLLHQGLDSRGLREVRISNFETEPMNLLEEMEDHE